MLVQADAHTIAVEQMRLGDHACTHYADDNVGRRVPGAGAGRLVLGERAEDR